MTQAELDAIPETGLHFEDRVIDGQTIRVPVFNDVGPLWQGEDDVFFIRDVNGIAWTTGWSGGKLYKRRLSI